MVVEGVVEGDTTIDPRQVPITIRDMTLDTTHGQILGMTNVTA